MKKLVLVLTAMAGALVVAGGVALAANITCPNVENGSFFTCRGTPNDDTINGTSESDAISARAGKDVVNARNGEDLVTGGTDKDIVRGGPGDDETLTGAEVRPLGDDEPPTDFPDQSNDLVYGGDGSDTIYGGFGQGGKDRVFGEEGNDMIVVAQRRSRLNVRVTKEIADCGPGQDVAYYDRAVDKVLDNCETTMQNFPPMLERQPEGMTGLLGGRSE